MKNRKQIFLDTKKFNLMVERMDSKYTYNESVEKLKKLITEGFGKTIIRAFMGVSEISDASKLFLRAIGDDITSIDSMLRRVDLKDFLRYVESDLITYLKNSGKYTKFVEDDIKMMMKSINAVSSARMGGTKSTVTGFIEQFPPGQSLESIKRDLRAFYEDSPELFNSGMPTSSRISSIDEFDAKIKDRIRVDLKYLSDTHFKPLIKEVVTTTWGEWTPKKILKISQGYDGYFIFKKGDKKLLFIERSQYPKFQDVIESKGYQAVDTNKPLKNQGSSGKEFQRTITNKDGNTVVITRTALGQFLINTAKAKNWLGKIMYGTSASGLIGLFVDCLWTTMDTDPKWREDKTTGQKEKIEYDFKECLLPLLYPPDPEFFNTPQKIGFNWLDVIPFVMPFHQLINFVSPDLSDYSDFLNGVNTKVKNLVYDAEVEAMEPLTIVQILNGNCDGYDASNILSSVISESGLGEKGEQLNKILGMVGINTNLDSDEFEKQLQELANKAEQAKELKDQIKKEKDRIHIEVQGLPDKSKFKVEGIDIKSKVKKACFSAKCNVISKKVNELARLQRENPNNLNCDLSEGCIDIYTDAGYKDKNTATGVDKCETNKKLLTELFLFGSNQEKSVGGSGFETPDFIKNITCSESNLVKLKSNMDTCEEYNKKKQELENEGGLKVDIEIDPVEPVDEIKGDDYDWQSFVIDSDPKNICLVTDTNLTSNPSLFNMVESGRLPTDTYKIVTKPNGFKIPVYKFNDLNITTMAKTSWCKKGVGIRNSEKSESDCVGDLIGTLKSSGCWGSFYE